jgi:thioredoxin-like negative regulator of GroEL
MNVLETQADFETLWFHPSEQTKWIVYFTAGWCKPCKALDLEMLETIATSVNIPIYKCDDDINNYTGGFCGVRSFPTFIYFQPKTVVSTFKSNKTDDVVKWIQSLK